MKFTEGELGEQPKAWKREEWGTQGIWGWYRKERQWGGDQFFKAIIEGPHSIFSPTSHDVTIIAHHYSTPYSNSFRIKSVAVLNINYFQI